MPERKDASEQRTSKERSGAGEATRPSTHRRESTDFPVTHRGTRSSGLGRSSFASPFGLMHELSDEMSRLFQNFGFGRGFGIGRAVGWGDEEESTWVPQVDVLRRGDQLVVRADLPGLEKDDITVDVTENVLTIRGERREEREEERGGYYWHERSAGAFVRSIPLPEGASPDEANARFENGVLEVSVPAPSREQEPRGRRIEIR